MAHTRTDPGTGEPALGHIQSLPSWLLNRASARGRRLVADALAQDGMRMPHHAVLSAVADLGPVAQAELGRTTGFDPKDMVGILNDLQAQELITRAPDPSDRRKNAITLTAEGRKRLNRLTELGDAANEELLSALSPAERELFLALLARVVDQG
ncbi:winged helix-turn-helix transcriptional regulator [Streptomyces mobaraensis NBRC 13819 = DSM 40847]|uniref:Winged helix-turn-helix transcriptional regulator n=2 Tax=Streptomyces mobaraensis TaxID=35621 RepID=A0A5N5WAF5_STRMB|nr:MarR family winged helix-turn-helix transcriptional regulator [Streptomyces mobaraensis]EMF00866.1 MarR family transcriptional regulator [Streptomyces mobaraensis NBRC 13819 = DSM 40847]KAB7846357.1 winged helix-turn-helix transcriptional regulator [Streptomyces mobaraensis]QTT76526.1 winged helix-turn-helix transcriptional regulator [Streptomyces mobaraensis NBRC 13819 = DSM 40847]